MTPAELYWLTRCDSIIAVCSIILVIAIIAAIATTFILTVGVLDTKMQETACRKVRAISVITMAVCMLVCVFMPTTKECIAIKVIPQIATTENCEKLKTINSQLLGSAIKWLESQVKHD